MKNSYTEYQKEETDKEIGNMVKAGMLCLTLSDFKLRLLNDFGLKLDMDPNKYLYKYYNTSNKQSYLCATTTAVDSDGKSYSNIAGGFYSKCKKDPNFDKAFMSFKMNNFTILKSGHILTI